MFDSFNCLHLQYNLRIPLNFEIIIFIIDILRLLIVNPKIFYVNTR